MARADYLPRRAASIVAEALADTRVVLINGARQVGKSTLVRAVAGERSAEWRDLDRVEDRQSAQADPTGFVSFSDLTVIDEIQISRPTVARYLRLLEEVFLIKRIPGWSRNLGSRVTNAAKLVFVDSGIAARLLAVDSHALRRPGAPFGPLLEGFVLSELGRQITWSDELVDLYHYRDQNKVEVDAILESRRGRVVGIEVKAASTVRAADFNGLRRLAERLGDDFVAGLVLYTGTGTLPFGPKLRAVPVSALWQL